jgi:hypothetical protein
MLGNATATNRNISVGDVVEHVRDPSLLGVITVVEDNGLSVMVRWDGTDSDDFQWINKVRKADTQQSDAAE